MFSGIQILCLRMCTVLTVIHIPKAIDSIKLVSSRLGLLRIPFIQFNSKACPLIRQK